jgi:tetratricopeptide (TPR) repeat protein
VGIDRFFRRPKRSRRVIVALLVFGGAGWLGWQFWFRPPLRAERRLAEARRLRSAGDNRRAEESAAAALKLNPRLQAAAFFAAECAAAQQEFARAAGYLQECRFEEPGTKLKAALLTARWNHQHLHRLADAEQAYRAALTLAADDVNANSGLAHLLALCGRSREAVPFVLRIVRQGVPTDLLVLLAKSDAAESDADTLQAARRMAPLDPNPLIGLAWRAAADDEADRAVELLSEALRLAPDHPAARVALGRQLLAARRFDELPEWARSLKPAADEFPEAWLVRARMAENDGDRKGAIRCYWEAARRAPESKTANFHLARLLAEAGETQVAEHFAAQLRQIQNLETVQDRVLFRGGGDGVEPLIELARSYEAAGRLWEACGWCLIALQVEPSDKRVQSRLRRLQRETEPLPLQLTVDRANAALATDLSHYALPEFRARHHASPAGESAPSKPLSFRDDALAAGLRFRYFNGAEEAPTQRMFEFTGGGIAVLDLDLDGFADVYFTQGRPWPPDPSAREYGDRIFRNVGGRRFEDVTSRAGIRGGGFGQGVTCGDVNADGFADVYAAHIGASQLWMNNGDGTFSDATRSANVAGEEADWTTSCVLADLNGDALPDLYAVNYVTAEDVFDRVCRHPDGSPKICMPFDFDGQPDRLWLNSGDGRFTAATPEFLQVAESGKGLGVAVWDAHGEGRLSLLVANDTTPNFFLVLESGENGRPRLCDRGIATGLALDADGKAKGSMGVALGDVNDDGRLDVHITDFLGEANTFYVGLPDGAFEDRSRETGLYHPTLDVLGFGTQFLDVDLDGRLELFTANGHIDDFRRFGKPYRMPPKLFRWNGRRFVEVPAPELGPYFLEQWLGRSVARLDWNRDGQDDLVVGHLHDETALLTNTTADAGMFLSIRLFGVHASRDAIGTIVSARIGERMLVRQLTAGDGYQACNERRLIFGVGGAGQVDELIVRWPSGTVQRFEKIATPREIWLPEGRPFVTAPEP